MWNCPLTPSGKRAAHSTCAKAFAAEHGFQLVVTADDGNCFFDTLRKFGERSGYQGVAGKSILQLRNELVDHMQGNPQAYDNFFFEENGSANSQMNVLRQNKVWDTVGNAGDVIPLAAAGAFMINIHMYNIADKGDYDAVEEIFLSPMEHFQVNGGAEVHIMRVGDGHFQLLWPKIQHAHVNSLIAPMAALAVSYKNTQKAKKNTTMKNNHNSQVQELNTMAPDAIYKSKKYTIPILTAVLKKLGVNVMDIPKGKMEIISFYKGLRSM